LAAGLARRRSLVSAIVALNMSINVYQDGTLCVEHPGRRRRFMASIV
jgi:hypothetical protein